MPGTVWRNEKIPNEENPKEKNPYHWKRLLPGNFVASSGEETRPFQPDLLFFWGSAKHLSWDEISRLFFALKCDSVTTLPPPSSTARAEDCPPGPFQKKVCNKWVSFHCKNSHLRLNWSRGGGVTFQPLNQLWRISNFWRGIRIARLGGWCYKTYFGCKLLRAFILRVLATL